MARAKARLDAFGYTRLFFPVFKDQAPERPERRRRIPDRLKRQILHKLYSYADRRAIETDGSWSRRTGLLWLMMFVDNMLRCSADLVPLHVRIAMLEFAMNSVWLCR